ncbi:MAG TPA: hypothetical protein VNU46_06345, partial [Gemmatimonadaceae bacterium]|nr:hypothetical protein [Gemmatimonadaceae bacterium]
MDWSVRIEACAGQPDTDTTTTDTPDAVAARFDTLARHLSTLDTLLAHCHRRGIPTQYERVDYTTIQHFLPWGREDLADHQLTHLLEARTIAHGLAQLDQEATTQLRAYLAGTRHALAVPQYVTQHPKIAGDAFVGDMRWPDGRLEHHRPIIFTGYGVAGQVRKDVPYFTDYGTNIIQIELGPSNVVFAPGTVDWYTATGPHETAHFALDTTVAHSGTRSMRITNLASSPAAAPDTGTAWLPYAVAPHTTYRVTAWIKGEGVQDAWLRSGPSPGNVHPLPTGTYGWRQIAFSY